MKTHFLELRIMETTYNKKLFGYLTFCNLQKVSMVL